MKIYKKIVSMLLAFTLIISGIWNNGLTASAGSNPQITVGEAWGKPGSVVNVDVSIANNPGVLGAELSVSYASGLTLIDAQCGEAFDVLTMSKPGKYNSPCKFAWDAQDVAEEDIKNGTILTLSFEVSSTVKVGENLDVNVACDTMYDLDLNELDVDVKSNNIRVIDYTPGDLNGDGNILTTDVILLRRHIVGGYNISIDENAADVNEDGKKTIADAVLIRRYIAGGYGVVLKPVKVACNHTLKSYPAKDATCTEDGYEAYWYCSSCQEYFSDANGTKVIPQPVIKNKTGHNEVIDPYKAPTYDATGLTEGSHCEKCGTVIKAQAVIPKLVKDEYNITYYITNGDTYLEGLEIENTNPDRYASEDGLVLKDLFVKGYTFEGWYDGAGSNGSLVKEIKPGEKGEKVLYAKWTPIEYTIQFNSPLDEIPSKKYTVNTGVTLTDPEWYRYTFTGWADEDGNLVTEIKKGTTGNITLYANWTSQRNQTIAKKQLEDPIIHEENNQFFFVYELGRIENVPLYTIKDFGYNSGEGITWEETVTTSGTISKTSSETIAEMISEATTNSSSWMLSEDWSNSYEYSTEHSEEVSSDVAVAGKKHFETTGKWNIGGSSGGSTTTTTEKGVSGKITGKLSLGAETTVPIGGLPVDINGGVEIGGEIGGEYKKIEADERNWNVNKGYEQSNSVSMDTEVSQSIGKAVSNKYGYGQTSTTGKSESITSTAEQTQTNSREYASTFSYQEELTEAKSVTYTNSGAKAGYYRIVQAGTVHVFAVVGYDIASSTYFTYTYNVVDDDTYEFLDYSAKTQGYDDEENGVLPFDVPYFVETYINTKVLRTQGLVVDIETGTIDGYTGDADHVMVPEYISVDNGDKTYSVVKIEKIAEGAFKNNTNIVEVKLPDTITEIPASAFEGCSSLTNVIAPSVTKIGAKAFAGCKSFKEYTVGTKVTELGSEAFTNVPKVIFDINNTKVLNSALESGAKDITVNLANMSDIVSNKTITISDKTDSFTFNGGTKTYSGVRIESDAKNTVINGATFEKCDGTPLVLSSENVTLNRVTVNASGLAMQLLADKTNVSLYGSVNLNTTSTNAVLTNSISLGLSNTSVTSKINVSGNLLVCGTIEGEKYLNVTNGTIIYCDSGSYFVEFDPNGGTVGETSRVVPCGQAIGTLPVPERPGYTFEGWFTTGGTQITADTTMSTEGSLIAVAKWSSREYTINWNTGTGYTITVNRTSSPYANAATGLISNGSAVYYGDELTVKYTAATGYTINSQGATTIKVTGNITSSDVYATASANSYTYNIVYKSVNGTNLGSTTATYKYGTTNTISAPAKSGYNTPGSQSVKWDSTSAKTITFTYGIASVSNPQSIASGDWDVWSSGKYGVRYSAQVEYRNRTSSSIEIRINWTNNITANTYYGYNQYFTGNIGGTSTGQIQIVPSSAWASQSSSARSKTVSSGWIKVSTGATNRSVSVSATFKDDGGVSGSWSKTMTIPTY